MPWLNGKLNLLENGAVFCTAARRTGVVLPLSFSLPCRYAEVTSDLNKNVAVGVSYDLDAFFEFVTTNTAELTISVPMRSI